MQRHRISRRRRRTVGRALLAGVAGRSRSRVWRRCRQGAPATARAKASELAMARNGVHRRRRRARTGGALRPRRGTSATSRCRRWRGRAARWAQRRPRTRQVTNHPTAARRARPQSASHPPTPAHSPRPTPASRHRRPRGPHVGRAATRTAPPPSPRARGRAHERARARTRASRGEAGTPKTRRGPARAPRRLSPPLFFLSGARAALRTEVQDAVLAVELGGAGHLARGARLRVGERRWEGGRGARAVSALLARAGDG